MITFVFFLKSIDSWLLQVSTLAQAAVMVGQFWWLEEFVLVQVEYDNEISWYLSLKSDTLMVCSSNPWTWTLDGFIQAFGGLDWWVGLIWSV